MQYNCTHREISLLYMNLNKKIPKSIEHFFNLELTLSKKCFSEGHLQQSWQHLERAHILGQPYVYEHSLAHWRMLKFGISTKNTREILGQLPRLIFGGIKSFVGKIPLGNTGGANVPPLRPMEIPEDLLRIING